MSKQSSRLAPVSTALLLLSVCAPLGHARSTQAAAVAHDAEDRGWPRQFLAQGHEVLVYAPQVDEWSDFEHITFRLAIMIGSKGQAQRTYGVLLVRSDTKVAYEERLVVLTNRKLVEATFPGVDATESERLRGIVLAAMPPDRPQTVALDRIVAGLDPAKIDARRVSVDTAPPKILYSDKSAVLVVFMGKPRFKAIPDSDLLFAVNTNWDVFLDPGAGRYYLRDEQSWLVTADLDKGPWTVAAALPAALSELPKDENWSEVRAALPGVPPTEVPVVHVAHSPAELIVTDGQPEMEPIPGTGLLHVVNTGSDLFYKTSEKLHYLLAAGRWFKSSALAGPWSAASTTLPPDFKQIPADSEAAHVLAAVPGTPEADEALIMASIPQKATIKRAEVSLEVSYEGEPKFLPIESTAVQYAYNTPFKVFLVEGQYYCCHNAVWFVAPTPKGAWVVCDKVPKAIYTIPPTSPMYGVTYVTVYDSDATTVVTGYTAGYTGATVATTGVVMFGLGLAVGSELDDDDDDDDYDDCCWYYHYNPCYYSYGCGAYWNGAYGGYVCGGGIYGPYGGAGHVAAYNPGTGTYARAGYAYGPSGPAGYRAAYNPTTGVAAGRAGGVTPYGSWGRSAITNGDEWVRGGHKSTAGGSVGAVQGSGGGAAVTAQGRYGNGATVAKTPDGDLYAAKDGNVYKRGDSGWEQTGNPHAAARPAQAQPASTSASRPASQAPHDTQAELQRQASVRDRGERNTARTNDYRRTGTTGSRPARGGRGRR